MSKKIFAILSVFALVAFMSSVAMAGLISTKNAWSYFAEETGTVTYADNKSVWSKEVEAGQTYDLGLQSGFKGQLKLVNFEPAGFTGWVEETQEVTCSVDGWTRDAYYEKGELIWAGNYVYDPAYGHWGDDATITWDGFGWHYNCCEECGWAGYLSYDPNFFATEPTLWDEFWAARDFVYWTYFDGMDPCFYSTYWCPALDCLDCVEGLCYLYGAGCADTVTEETLLYYIDILNNYAPCEGCELCDLGDGGDFGVFGDGSDEPGTAGDDDDDDDDDQGKNNNSQGKKGKGDGNQQ